MAPLLKDDMAVPADPMSLNDNIPAPTVILALPDDILIRQHLGSPTLSGNYMVQVMTTNVPWSQHHHGNGHTMTGQMPLGVEYTVASHAYIPFAAAGSLATLTYDRAVKTWGPRITMPDPTSPQPPTGRVVAWYTGIGLPEYNITDYTDPNIPDWSGEEKWKIQAKYFAPWLVGGLVLLFPIVGFVIWWCVKRRGSKKLEWTRELRQKEAAVRKEVEENKEKTRKEDKALAKQKKKEKKERARAKVAQEKEKEKAIKKLAKERFVQGSSLTTEGEDFSKDGGVSGGISTGTSDKTKGLAT